MAIREIRLMGDEILTKTCKPVKEMTPRLKELIGDMLDTMYHADGVGLAAPQVGILRRIAVVDVTEEQNDPICLVNPEIIETSGEQTGVEGCLSVPDKAAYVTRPNYVKVRALDEDMNPYEIEGEEILARALIHEIEHLDGMLYVDKSDDGKLYDTEQIQEMEKKRKAKDKHR